jgi:hypothetical protein
MALFAKPISKRDTNEAPVMDTDIDGNIYSLGNRRSRSVRSGNAMLDFYRKIQKK